MVREARTPRPDLKEKVEKLGLTFHTLDNEPYWFESAAYRFEAEEIALLESSTNGLHEMCLAAVEKVIREESFSRLAIPESAHRVISQAWEDDPPAIYGRFDLAYDGVNPPKLLEYNADTPTSLLEAAVIQWHWLQEVESGADQFNSIWEGLVGKWTSLKEEGYLKSGRVDFGCMDAMEDVMTTAVLMDTAREAGLEVNIMQMHEIGWDSRKRRFVDQHKRPIQTLFKLYPWEWILRLKYIPLYILAVSAFAYFEEAIWDWFVWRDHVNIFGPFYLPAPTVALILFVPLLTMPQTTHYVLDAFIWRVNKKGKEELRAVIG